MRKMKDSGIEWIGQIPSDWDVSKIKYHCSMQSGDNLTSSDIEPEGEYEVYGANGFRGYYSRYNCEGVHILVGRQGALAGNVHLVDGRYWATDHAVITKITDKTSVKFLYYSLVSADLNQYAFETAAQPGLAVSVIVNKSVPIPPLAEQQKIADFLDEKCGEIDSIRSDVQREIEILNDYKKSVITEAVTKGLNPKAKLKDSGIEWIGNIPDGWNSIKAKYLFKQRNSRGNTIDLQLLSPSQKFGVIPQSKLEELTTQKVVKLNEKVNLAELKTIHKGDFCISLRSFQGGFEYSEYEGVVSPAYQVFYSIVPSCNGYYRYLFKEKSFIEKMNSFTMSLRDGKNIAFEDFANSEMPVPPLSEQKAIADYLDEKCSEIDATIADKQKQLETLDEYKKSLIFEYVTGKKQVS